MMSSVTGNLCNKCPKQLVKQNSSYSDYFNAISGLYRTAEPIRRPCDIYHPLLELALLSQENQGSVTIQLKKKNERLYFKC